MARIRTIKPEMASDEALAETSIAAQLLAVRILNYADDEGYFNANPALIKAACFPLVELDIGELLAELAGIGYLRLGEGSDGRQYGKVRKFSDHQKVNRPYESKIKHLVSFTEHSLNGNGTITAGKEKEKEKEKEANNPPCPHQEIISIYHEVLPERPAVMVKRWHGNPSAANLKARWEELLDEWGEDEYLHSLEWWRDFFGSVRDNDWRMGRDKWKGVDLHWLLKRSNFDKVVEDWHNKREAA